MNQLSDLEVLEKFEKDIEQASHVVLVGGMEDCLPVWRRILFFAKCWIQFPAQFGRWGTYEGAQVLQKMVDLQEHLEKAAETPTPEEQIAQLEKERDEAYKCRDQMREERDALRQSVQQYIKEKESLKRLLGRANGEQGPLKEKIWELEQERDKAWADRNTIMLQRDEYKQRLDKLAADLTDITSTLP